MIHIDFLADHYIVLALSAIVKMNGMSSTSLTAESLSSIKAANLILIDDSFIDNLIERKYHVQDP